MNNFTCTARLTRDPELRYTQNDNKEVCKFGIAIKKKFGDGADFLNCVAFGKTADIISKHFHKGKEIGITGRIQTGSYDNAEGKKVYTTDIVVESFDFIGGKTEPTGSTVNDTGFMPADDGSEDLPF